MKRRRIRRPPFWRGFSLSFGLSRSLKQSYSKQNCEKAVHGERCRMGVHIGEFRIKPYEQANSPRERSKPGNGEEEKTPPKRSSLHAKPHSPGEGSKVKAIAVLRGE